MKVTLECSRCEEKFIGYEQTEEGARKSAAMYLKDHLTWVHGKEILEEAGETVDEYEEEAEEVSLLHAISLVSNTPAQDRMLDAIERSWAILQERSARYNEAWLNRGAIGNVLEILKLSDRIKAQLWDNPPEQCEVDRDLDDLYDLLNYTVACISQAEQGHWTRGIPGR